MSQPNIAAERAEALYTLCCHDCEHDLYEGTAEQIEAFMKRQGWDDLDWDGVEEGYCCCLCNDCAWLLKN